MYDLHMHSNCSDGTLPPERLIEAAGEKGLTLASLTDHDTAAGVMRAAAAAERIGLPFISGAEFDAEHEGELHILGYGVDPGSEGVLYVAREERRTRLLRNKMMLYLLERAGVPAEREIGKPIELVTKPDMAAAMVKVGFCKTMGEAFSEYLAHGKQFDVPRKHLPKSRIMEIIQEANGVAVLAHPMKLKGDAEETVRELSELGLWGLEAYYSEASEEQTRFFLSLCEKYRLHPTCGSDHHGPGRRSGAVIGSAWRDVPELYETENLLKEMNGVTPARPAGRLLRRLTNNFIPIGEFQRMAEEISAELPEELYKGLNGGITISEEAKLHRNSRPEHPLYVLGEYNYGGHTGRYITIYYGSFRRVHRLKRGQALRDELRRVLLHELRHHLETRAGEHGLEYEDAAFIAEYLGEE